MNNNSHTEVDYQLLGRYLAGEASPAEAMQLEEWLSASPENKQQFEQISKVWSTLSSEKTCVMPNKEALFQQISDQFPQLLTPRVLPLKKMIAWTKIAATFLVVTGVALLSVILLKNHRYQDTGIITRQTQQATLHDTLPDGSVAILNSYSQLQYPEKFTDTKREVQLTGESWFSITNNPLKPFVLSTGPVHIQVIGTSFNVRQGKDTIEVAVKTGVVRMYNDRDSITIPADKKGIYHIPTQRFFIVDALNWSEFSYATRVFVFEMATLKEVCDQLQKAYDVTIVFNNKDLEKYQLTGTFGSMPIEDVLKLLATVLNLQYRIDHKIVYLSGNGYM
jgi:transmembrane sensor